MDQTTRNKLQRATQDARRLLEREFGEQLEGTFDILPDGTILPEAGAHLDSHQRLVRGKLVAAVQHQIAGGKQPAEAVDDYRREAAFTCLNRFVALKMLEARGLVQLCVSKGDESAGFKEFTGLAPGLSQLPDKGYRLYLESLLDELSIEVKVLFDRRDPASLLWPRPAALAALLAVWNDTELAGVWDQDETIGWVYQYFNSQDERRAMRDASQAPRNSRELAVRNQFFTPRYVVQFLTDNTLGRIWYEMRKGDTRLKEQCEYLVRRPTEIFLAEDEPLPEDENRAADDLSQEQLLQQPAYIRHRPPKDPRDLNILDPACGSGHFLLYCFDVLQTIYEEAWEEQNAVGSRQYAEGSRQNAVGSRQRADLNDPEAVRQAVVAIGYQYPPPNALSPLPTAYCLLPTALSPLPTAYPTLNALRAAVPELILRHNLHGIDIDPRCVQIAALALWMRAQRAWQAAGIASAARPRITTIRVVCAAPMPGEESLLQEFLDKQLSATIEDRELGKLVRRAFKAMTLAGEAGSLLKIEEEIAIAVAEAKKAALAGPRLEQRRLFDARPAPPKQKQLDFETFEITDEAFWEQAEQRLYAALREYAERAEREGGFQRRLFAHDAAGGFSFIDVCRQRYDVALMNPPFGEGTDRVLQLLVEEYPNAKRNVYIGFVYRAIELLCQGGRVGAITDATFIHQTRYEEYRADLLRDSPFGLTMLAANGWGILDAYVETASIVVADSPTPTLATIDLRGHDTKHHELTRAIIDLRTGRHAEDAQYITRHVFRKLPKNVLAFWLPAHLLSLYEKENSLDPSLIDARCGMSSSDNPRFYKLWWEVDVDSIGIGKRWQFLANGGPPCPLLRVQVYVVNYARQGREAKSRVAELYGTASRTIINESFYLRAGLTFGKRTESFTAQYLPSDQVFSNEGQAIFPHSNDFLLPILAYLNSSAVAYLLNSIAGQHKEAGYVGSIPSIPKSVLSSEPISRRTQRAFEILALCAATIPESQVFCWPLAVASESTPSIAGTCHAIRQFSAELSGLLKENDIAVDTAIGFGRNEKRPWQHREWSIPVCLYGCTDARLEETIAMDFVAYVMGMAFDRWALNAPSSVSAVLQEPTQSLSPRCPALQVCAGDGISRILVDDPGHVDDVVRALEETSGRTESLGAGLRVLSEARRLLAPASDDLRPAIAERFFEGHIERYSRSRRKAPIYWELGTPSGSYTVWLYYHRFTKDTFYKVLHDYVKPKVEHEQRKLDRLRAGTGDEPTRSQRAELDAQESFVAELKTFQAEIERIAPLWNPDLNDGVVINYAPLWRLVKLRSWQTECKDCWHKLVAGDYDWAHLSMHLWPERVVPKCADDRSLAIAHELEDMLWVEDDSRWRKLQEPKREIADQKARRDKESHRRLRDGLRALAEGQEGTLSAAEVWRQLMAGELDESLAALCLHPRRVLELCLADPDLARHLDVKPPGKRTKAALDKLVKQHETAGYGTLTGTVRAALAECPEPFAALWRRFEEGGLDDLPLALALWPDRVVDRCTEDRDLADRHDLTRYFWYCEPSGEWRRRKSPHHEVADEVARRENPTVKAALQSLLDAGKPGGNGGTRRRKKKR